MTIIGVIGTGRGVGTTHTAIAIATGIKKRARVAVVEKTGRDSLKSLGTESGVLDEYDEGDFFRYKGVDYFLKDAGLTAYNRNYDALVIDYGDGFSDETVRCDGLFVVMSPRPWNRGTKSAYGLLEKIDDAVGLENTYGVVPFTERKDKKYFRDEFEGMTFFFPEFEADPTDKCSMDYTFLIKNDKAVKKQFRVFETKIDELEREKEKKKEENELLQTKFEEQEKERALQEERLRKVEEEKREKEESIASYISEVENYAKQVDGFTKQLSEKEQMHQEELRKAEEEKTRLEQRLFASTHDELTGLGNRRVFREKLDSFISEGLDYTLIYIDLNNLKTINDSHGHSEGDKYLKAVTKELLKEFECVYRIGGDEFAVITNDSEFSPDRLQKIDRRLSELTTESDGFYYEISYGYADSSEGSCGEVVNLADSRMYENKAYKKALREEESGKLSSVFSKPKEEPEAPVDEPEGEEDTGREEPVMEFTGIKEKKAHEPDKDTIEGRIRQNIACYTYSDENVIPNTFPIGEDDPFRKDLDTMFFSRIRLSFEYLKYTEVRLWVFATEYRKAPFPVNVIVVWEENGTYSYAYGKNNQVTIASAEFMINGRFLKDGSFSVGIIPMQESVKVLERNEELNLGKYTPAHFGLIAGDAEYYPLRQNFNGVCDCIKLKNGNLYLSAGNEEIDKKAYEFILSQDTFEAITE